MDWKKIAPWNWFKQEESVSPAARRLPGFGSPADPFAALRAEMDRVFEDAVRHSFPRMPWLAEASASKPLPLRPVVDISEGRKAYTVRVELPGVEPDDVSIEVEEHTLVLRADKRQTREEEDEGYHCVERSYGAVQRGALAARRRRSRGHRGPLQARRAEAAHPEAAGAGLARPQHPHREGVAASGPGPAQRWVTRTPSATWSFGYSTTVSPTSRPDTTWTREARLATALHGAHVGHAVLHHEDGPAVVLPEEAPRAAAAARRRPPTARCAPPRDSRGPAGATLRADSTKSMITFTRCSSMPRAETLVKPRARRGARGPRAAARRPTPR